MSSDPPITPFYSPENLTVIARRSVTGQPPYPGPDAGRQAREADLHGALERLGRCGADGELVALARRCLAADPAGRPRDAGVLAAEVTAYLKGVQERLRRAELARVEAQARAEEEAKRRVL